MIHFRIALYNLRRRRRNISERQRVALRVSS